MNLDDVSNLLVVILDTNPFGWDALSEYIPFDVAIREFLVFLNAHLSSNQNNDLAVLASHTNFVQYLYPSVQVSSKDNEKAVEENKEDKDFQKSNIYRPFYLMNKQIQDNLKKLIDKANEQDEDTPSTMIGGSLCMALAYVNRAMQSASKNRLNARILIISVSSDITFQYIPIMNCIFGAQKKVYTSFCRCLCNLCRKFQLMYVKLEEIQYFYNRHQMPPKAFIYTLINPKVFYSIYLF